MPQIESIIPVSQTRISTAPIQTTFTISTREINAVNPPTPESYASFLKLPLSLRTWLLFEQKYNAKISDRDFAPPVIDYSLSEPYMPENRHIIELDVYRVHVDYLQSLSLPGNSFAGFIVEDQNTWTLLAHPSMRSHGALSSPMVAYSRRKFFFAPMASPRTGITWELGAESSAFITKLSIADSRPINGQIGKMALGIEGAISMHQSAVARNILASKDPTFLNHFILEELHLGLKVPEYLPVYGMLFRPIPRDILSGQHLFIPFFTLAFTQSDSGQQPLLPFLLTRSGLNLKDFLVHHIYLPVIRFILRCSKHGIYPESLHGQNLLIGFNMTHDAFTSGVRLTGLSGEVRYRDSCDMRISEDYLTNELRAVRRMAEKSSSPITRGCYIYSACANFVKLTLYPILVALNDLQRKGLISFPPISILDQVSLECEFFIKLRDIFIEEMNTQLVTHEYEGYEENCITVKEFIETARSELRLREKSKRKRQWMVRASNMFDLTLEKSWLSFKIIPEAERARRAANTSMHIQYVMRELEKQAHALDEIDAALNRSSMMSPYGQATLGMGMMQTGTTLVPNTGTMPLYTAITYYSVAASPWRIVSDSIV